MGSYLTTRRKKLIYWRGPAASGSLRICKKPVKYHETFLGNENAHTKYRQFRRKFPRFKLFVYDIDEIWSIDFAYVDKFGKYNHEVEGLLVAVDVHSRKLILEPMRCKSAVEIAKTFARMITKAKPQNFLSDEGIEFRGAFKRFCEGLNIATYSSHSQSKSVRFYSKKHPILEKHFENTNT